MIHPPPPPPTHTFPPHPPLQEVARYCAKWTYPIRKMSSPVFLSVGPGGSVSEGLGGLPEETSGPLILVGNHQVGERREGGGGRE